MEVNITWLRSDFAEWAPRRLLTTVSWLQIPAVPVTVAFIEEIGTYDPIAESDKLKRQYGARKVLDR